MKEKTTPEGIVDKVKARVVAGGNQQDKSIYTLDETSSPTVSTAAVFITVAIAANEGRHITRIAIVRSNMHVAVDVNHVIDIQIR